MQQQSLVKALQWMLDNPQAHPANMVAVAAEALLKKDKPLPTIVAAAIRCEGECGDFIISAPPPARHHNLLRAYYDLKGEPHRGSENQGFLTSEGVFVTREEAYKIVVAANQQMIDHPSRVEGKLFSEDLW